MIDNVFYEIGGGAMPILDYANPLHTFDNPTPSQSGHGLTFTATSDCYILGSLSGIATDTISINGTPVIQPTTSAYTGDTVVVPLIKIKTGDVVVVGVANSYLHVFAEL